jgi:hypothetical protein
MPKKRYRRVYAKPGELKVAFGRMEFQRDPLIVYYHGDGYLPGRGAARVLSDYFEGMKLDGKTLVEHLIERGYDIETLKFTIQKKDG